MRFWIWSQEHSAWWRTNRQGYTRDFLQAGRFSVKETAEILETANMSHREFGKAATEFAILCTTDWAFLPKELVEVESEESGTAESANGTDGS